MTTRSASFHEAVVERLPRLVSEDSCLGRWMNSRLYTFVRPLATVADATIVVFELAHATNKAQDMQWNASVPDEPVFLILTDIFCVLMVLDMLFMFIVEFPRFDFIWGRSGYRWFLILTVTEQVLQVVSQHAYPDQRAVSTFRIVVGQLSFLRTFRGFMVLPEVATKMELGVQELRVMIQSLMGAFQPLLFCATPFIFILINFAVFVCQGTFVFLVKHHISNNKELADYFGTFNATLLSLYQALLGGMDWGDLYNVLRPLNWYLWLGFLAFMCFNFIAMLNIVAAVFIKVAFIRSENDKEFQIQQEKESKKTYLDTMQSIFLQLDEDKDGKLYRHELENHFKDPDIGAYFSKLGMDVNEVQKVFMVLDEDESGEIDEAEFMFGCLRLKGEAKGLDLAILHRDVTSLRTEIASLRRQNGTGGSPGTEGHPMFTGALSQNNGVNNPPQCTGQLPVGVC